MFNLSKRKSSRCKTIPHKIEDLDFLQWFDVHEQKKLRSKRLNFGIELCWEEYPFETILPIHYAAARANKNGIQWILNQPGKPQDYINTSTGSGLVPLHFAVLFDNLETLKELIDKGAEINLPEEVHGHSALHLACKNSKTGAVRILLDSLVNTAATDKDGLTPKELAKRENKIVIVNILEQKEEDKEFVAVAKSMVEFKKHTDDKFDVVNDQLSKLREQMTTISLSGFSTPGMNLSRADTMSRCSFQDSGIGTPAITDYSEEPDNHCRYAYKEADIVQTHFETLMKQMRRADEIVTHLFSLNLVDIQFKAKMRSLTMHNDKNELLLDMVMSHSKPIYDAFITALRKYGEHHLAELIVRTTGNPPRRHTSCPNICDKKTMRLYDINIANSESDKPSMTRATSSLAVSTAYDTTIPKICENLKIENAKIHVKDDGMNPALRHTYKEGDTALKSPGYIDDLNYHQIINSHSNRDYNRDETAYINMNDTEKCSRHNSSDDKLHFQKIPSENLPKNPIQVENEQESFHNTFQKEVQDNRMVCKTSQYQANSLNISKEMPKELDQESYFPSKVQVEPIETEQQYAICEQTDDEKYCLTVRGQETQRDNHIPFNQNTKSTKNKESVEKDPYSQNNTAYILPNSEWRTRGYSDMTVTYQSDTKQHRSALKQKPSLFPTISLPKESRSENPYGQFDKKKHSSKDSREYRQTKMSNKGTSKDKVKFLPTNGLVKDRVLFFHTYLKD